MFIIRRIVGDSMLPGLYPGSLVIGCRWPRKPRIGRVVIITHNGTEKIKRISKLDTGTLYVVGDNPGSSTDSRDFGWLPASAIKAVVIWPRTRHRN